MQTSILQVVTPELAEVASGEDAAEVARLMGAAERLTLLTRLSGGPRTHQRYHPLVRGFLEARFRATDGPDAVAALHRRTAAAAAATDWKVAAHHYREAGDTEAMLGVVAGAIPTIMGNGQYALAQAFIGPISPTERPPGFELILSRVDMQHGDYEAALAASQAVLDSGVTDPIQRDHALLNLVTLALNYGDAERAITLGKRLAETTADAKLRAIAEATYTVLSIEDERDFESVNRRLRSMAQTQRGESSHHFGVTMLNLALNSVVQDRVDDAMAEASEALESLEATSGAIEHSAARVIQASILLRFGRVSEATDVVTNMTSDSSVYIPNEAFADAAEAFDAFGSRVTALSLLDRIGDRSTHTIADRRLIALTRARMAIRSRDIESAKTQLANYPPGRPTVVGGLAAFKLAEAHLALVCGDRSARKLLRASTTYAAGYGATGIRRVGELLLATMESSDDLNRTLTVVHKSSPWHLTYLAEEMAAELPRLTPESLERIASVAAQHPERWRTALRATLDRDGAALNLPAARLLESIGDSSDIPRLRHLARQARRRPEATSLGRALARRLANIVRLEDQGRISLEIGNRVVLGSTIRRKVLAMLAYLVTRPDLSATRDQVLDALWPDLDPEVAVNSLNQTVYFLRRVFEEQYSDDLSPGYVHHDSDVVWLDSDLISSRSVDCRQLIRDLPDRPDPADVDRLTRMYRGRFALDFEYEEWAAAYRDTLHATYLEIVERSVLDDFTMGHYDRGINIARRALDVDPSAEQIEICLLRLYRVTGAHSAAAEQYAHYAAVMRDELGLEPPPLESL
jgi:DNA-binding SARP family transcriptional activator